MTQDTFFAKTFIFQGMQIQQLCADVMFSDKYNSNYARLNPDIIIHVRRNESIFYQMGLFFFSSPKSICICYMSQAFTMLHRLKLAWMSRGDTAGLPSPMSTDTAVLCRAFHLPHLLLVPHPHPKARITYALQIRYKTHADGKPLKAKKFQLDTSHWWSWFIQPPWQWNRQLEKGPGIVMGCWRSRKWKH